MKIGNICKDVFTLGNVGTLLGAAVSLVLMHDSLAQDETGEQTPEEELKSSLYKKNRALLVDLGTIVVGSIGSVYFVSKVIAKPIEFCLNKEGHLEIPKHWK